MRAGCQPDASGDMTVEATGTGCNHSCSESGGPAGSTGSSPVDDHDRSAARRARGAIRDALAATAVLLAGMHAACIAAPSRPPVGRTSSIAYVRGGCIWTVSPEGSGARRVTSGAKDSRPSWHPDGHVIAFIRGDSAQAGSSAWVVRTDGTGLRRVSPAGVSCTSAVWSPDGAALAYLYEVPLASGRDAPMLGWIDARGRRVAQPLNVGASGLVGQHAWPDRICDWSAARNQIALVVQGHMSTKVVFVSKESGRWAVAKQLTALRTGATAARAVMCYASHPTDELRALVTAGPGLDDFAPLARSSSVCSGEGTLIKDLLTSVGPDLDDVGWSPDGQHAICSADGYVIVTDVLTSASKRICRGWSPKWLVPARARRVGATGARAPSSTRMSLPYRAP